MKTIGKKAWLTAFALGVLGITSSFSSVVTAQTACTSNVPSGFNYPSITGAGGLFPEGGPINPSYITGTASANLPEISNNATVAVTFMGSNAGYDLRLGYFKYNSSNAIVAGSQTLTTLHNHNPGASAPGATVTIPGTGFSAGENIGFFVDVDTDHDGTANYRIYSLTNLNPDSSRHVAVAAVSSTPGLVAFGVEDTLVGHGPDNDFNDFVFAVNVCGTINSCGIPDNLCSSLCSNDPDCQCDPQTQNPLNITEVGHERACVDSAGHALLGVCGGGVQNRICGTDHRWNTWGDCSIQPSAETCDGLDNDCNGVVDDNIPTVGNECQNSGTGLCATNGHLVCRSIPGTVPVYGIACDAGTAPAIDDGNLCTVDTCDAGVVHNTLIEGCRTCQIAEDCNDGNVCNGAEACVEGVCQAGTPLVCNDGNACTANDRCDPTLGRCTADAASETCVPCNSDTAASACDDHNPCTADSCGDGGTCQHTLVEPGTSCSDGNACNGAEVCNSDGFCSAGTPVVCNDDNRCTVDSCNSETGTCSFTVSTELCPTPETVCGNGTLEAGEQCDDGNLVNGDGCSSTCQIETPICDLTLVGTPCSVGVGACAATGENVCGDNGIVCNAVAGTPSIEICNGIDDNCDGSIDEGLICSSNQPVCGNHIVEAGEACDDGNTTNGDGCSSTCALENTSPVCGNGVAEPGEACDDGNVVDGDGCSSTCTIEQASTAVAPDPGISTRDNSQFQGSGDVGVGGCSFSSSASNSKAPIIVMLFALAAMLAFREVRKKNA